MMLRKGLFLTAMVLCALMMTPDGLWARGRGRSRSVSRPSSGRTIKRTTPSRRSGRPKKTWGSKSTTPKKAPTRKKWGSSKAPTKKATSTSKRKMSAADKKLAAKAKKNGTSYKDRKSAVTAFKQKNATKYTSRYKTKPTTRPAHIPQTTMVGGVSYNVTYNQQYGGYGHMSPLGTWIMYDMFMDAAMTDRMMRTAGYAHPGMYTPVAVTTPTVIHHHSDGSGFLWFIVLCVGIGVVIIVISVARSSTI